MNLSLESMQVRAQSIPPIPTSTKKHLPKSLPHTTTKTTHPAGFPSHRVAKKITNPYVA
jgi:hypothetical protein